MEDEAHAGEPFGLGAAERIEAETRAALRRKPVNEAALAGALRVLAPYSPRLASLLVHTVDTLLRRGSLARPLFLSGVRALGELDHPEGAPALCRALGMEDAGGLATIFACCLHSAPELGEPLARVAASRHSHLAFAAQVARLARGESDGQSILGVAPKIKEAHRIGLSSELFFPLLWQRPLPVAIGPALGVLRDAERHLGRWLVLGEIAARAGDGKPLEDARRRACEGPPAARAAWSMVAWALGGARDSPPSARPTLELVARLSDRPSADRDTTFLFRLAASRADTARGLLEHLARSPGIGREVALRAELYLARDHGRADLERSLYDVARSARSEPLRGLAAAALHDVGARDAAAPLALGLLGSKHMMTTAWAALVTLHAASKLDEPVVTEPRFRRLQLGWVE
jgi:hypothetical protein